MFFLNLNWSFEPRWRVVNGVGTVCSPDLKMTSCRRYNFYSSVPSWTSIIFARSATWGHQRLGQWRWNWYPGWSEVAPNFCSRHQNFTYLSQFGQALLNSFFCKLSSWTIAGTAKISQQRWCSLDLREPFRVTTGVFQKGVFQNPVVNQYNRPRLRDHRKQNPLTRCQRI